MLAHCHIGSPFQSGFGHVFQAGNAGPFDIAGANEQLKDDRVRKRRTAFPILAFSAAHRPLCLRSVMHFECMVEELHQFHAPACAKDVVIVRGLICRATGAYEWATINCGVLRSA